MVNVAGVIVVCRSEEWCKTYPSVSGMEGERGERPARFNREGGDRDNYRRSVAPREYPNHLFYVR